MAMLNNQMVYIYIYIIKGSPDFVAEIPGWFFDASSRGWALVEILLGTFSNFSFFFIDR